MLHVCIQINRYKIDTKVNLNHSFSVRVSHFSVFLSRKLPYVFINIFMIFFSRST